MNQTVTQTLSPTLLVASTSEHLTSADALLVQRVRSKLNASTAQLDEAVTNRLFSARQAALAGWQPPKTSWLGLQWQRYSAWSERAGWVRSALIAVVVVGCVLGGEYMASVQHAAELEEIDSALLSDDLPLNAYLDRGFDKWLNTSVPQ